jgi:hypothetical protein
MDQPPNSGMGTGHNVRKWLDRRDDCLNDVHDWLVPMAHQTRSFQEFFSAATRSEVAHIEMPAEFPKVWIHLIISLVSCVDDLGIFDVHSEICGDLLDKGMRKMVRSVNESTLLDNLVLAPAELALLMSFQLLRDVTKSYPDISGTYSEYLRSLVSVFKWWVS